MNLFVRKWGERVIRNRQYAVSIALIFAFISFFDVPVGWLSSVIIALVTLQNGPKQGLIVVAWAMLPAVAMLYLGHIGVFFNILLLDYLLIGAFAYIVNKYSWAVLLQLSALLGVIAVTVIHLYFPDVQNWWVTQISSVLKEYKSLANFGLKSEGFDNLVQYTTEIALGTLGVSIIAINLFHLLVARWWQSSINPSIALQKEWCEFRVSYIAVFALFTIFGGLYVNAPLFVDLLPLAIMPAFLAGLSLLHAVCTTKKNGTLFLVIFYSLFIVLLFIPYLLVAVVFMGCLDSFVNFRKRLRVTEVIENK